jgi:hypothetical protein
VVRGCEAGGNTQPRALGYFVRAKAEPHCGQGAQNVAVGKQRNISVRGAAYVDDPLAPRLDGSRIFAAGVAMLPHVPVGPLRVDFVRGDAFIFSIVPPKARREMLGVTFINKWFGQQGKGEEERNEGVWRGEFGGA